MHRARRNPQRPDHGALHRSYHSALLVVHCQLLVAPRVGRARTVAARIVWHDSADRALFAQGLTVTEQRGTWSLERIVPDSGFWPPGGSGPCNP